MEPKTPWQIVALIMARINGIITEKESVQLDAWLNSSLHNRALYEKIQDGSNFERYGEKYAEYDDSLKYKAFCHYMEVRKRKQLMKRWIYAAAVVVPLIVAFFLWERGGGETVVIAREQIKHGSTQALLTLSGGKVITLNDGVENVNIERVGVVVEKGTLIYSPDVSVAETEYHTIDIPRGGEYMLKLADGTRVWLNSGTHLRYPVRFNGQERRVFLEGEAFFEVYRDTAHPFIVTSGVQQLMVLGTSFCVRAYGDESCIMTTLESGKVNISAHNQQVVLLPGYQSKVVRGEIAVTKVNTSLYTAWYRGQFIFIDQSLEDILNTLSRWYNMEVFYTDPKLKELHFTGELRRYGDIRELLDKIGTLEKVKFEIKDRAVTVSEY